jgi:hypothetical protein
VSLLDRVALAIARELEQRGVIIINFEHQLARAAIEAMRDSPLRAAAEAVCWFDWSDNDEDAVAAIAALSAALKGDE